MAKVSCIVAVVFILLAGAVGFGGGYLSARVELGLDPLAGISLGEYRRNALEDRRNSEQARRDSESLRRGIEGAIESVDSGSKRLENSVQVALRLGSLQGQIRGLSAALREYAQVIKDAVAILEGFIDTVSAGDPGAGDIPTIEGGL